MPHGRSCPGLVELAGGPDGIVEKARRYIADRRPLEALHLTDIVVGVEPSHRAARETQIAALELLIDASGGTAFDEMGWLESEIRLAKEAIA